MSVPAPSSVVYFGGRPDRPNFKPWEEVVWTEGAFSHYVWTVWVNEHEPPTDLQGLARFDAKALWPEYKAYIATHGRTPERGTSLEETWLGSQLMMGKPIDCVLSTAQPEQPVDRITRLHRLSPSEIWTLLGTIYADPSLERPWPPLTCGICPLTISVYDGDEVGHVVAAYTQWEDRLHFTDPWPTGSLLCKERNNAGVDAKESKLITPGWSITRAEFERVVFAVWIHARAPGFGRGIPLTADERQAAEANERMMSALRKVAPRKGRSGKPFDGMKTMTRLQFGATLDRMWEVKVGLNEGDDPNESGEDGTALHAAAAKGHLDIVKLLRQYGADPTLKSPAGRTAAELAETNGHADVAEYLRTPTE